MGEHFFVNPMISIQMCDVYVVLGIQWLQSFGKITLNFQSPFIIFFLQVKELDPRVIQRKPSKVINYDRIKKMLKMGHQGVIVQLCSLDVQTFMPSSLVGLKKNYKISF